VYSAVFESVAFDDISEAKQYYRKVSDQLAEKFQLAIAECSVDLQKNPYLFQKIIGESRFHKVVGFPFVLVYVIYTYSYNIKQVEWN